MFCELLKLFSTGHLSGYSYTESQYNLAKE